jgi:hypothetical protein
MFNHDVDVGTHGKKLERHLCQTLNPKDSARRGKHRASGGTRSLLRVA